MDAMLGSELRASMRVREGEREWKMGGKGASSRLNHHPNRTLAETFWELRDSDRHRHARVCASAQFRVEAAKAFFGPTAVRPAESASEVPDRRGPCPAQFGRERLDPGSRKWRSVDSHTQRQPRESHCDHHFGSSIVVRIGSAAASSRTCRDLAKELRPIQRTKPPRHERRKRCDPNNARIDRICSDTHPPRPCQLRPARHVGCARIARWPC